MISTYITLFGATGDLARQKLFPTLYNLFVNAQLPGSCTIIAVGRRPYTQQDFLDQIEPSLRKIDSFSEESYKEFASHIQYVEMDFQDEGQYQRLVSAIPAPSNRLFYFAVPPHSFTDILGNLVKVGLTEEKGEGWAQVVIEKPFGEDRESACQLDARISALLHEKQVYRVDHYLGKETVQNILAFRFTNGIFESIWNKDHIDHIQITVAEEEGIGTRANYYDSTGALKDIVQNHILQLVSLLTMEQPAKLSMQDLSDQKIQVLRSMTADVSRTVFGQYEGYKSEKDVPGESVADTYAMTTFLVDNSRWQGVPIFVRTGKRLPQKISEISVQFKPGTQTMFSSYKDRPLGNILTFRIQPDEGIELTMAIKRPQAALEVQNVKMEFCYAMSFRRRLLDAYERLFLDILAEDKVLSLRTDTIEESWRIIDELLLSVGKKHIFSYEANSWGPEAADAILANDGRKWLAHESTVCNGVQLELE